MRKEVLSASAWATLALGGEAVAQATGPEWRLVYAVRYETEPVEGKRPDSRPSDREEEMTVGLGEGYFRIEKGRGQAVYDFRRKRVVATDEAGKGWHEVSLFTDLAFRVSEYGNRVGLGGMSREMGVSFGELSRLELETLFGIEMPGEEKSRIVEQEEGGMLRFRAGDAALAECAFSETALADPLATMLGRFLAYHCALHPQVRRAIVARKKVPKILEFRAREEGERRQGRFELKRAARGPRVGPDPPKGEGLTSAFEDLEPLLRRASSRPSGGTPVRAADFLKASTEAAAQGRFLDAFLAIAECRFQTGEDPPKEAAKALFEKGSEDPALVSYMASFREEDPQRAMQLLDSIPRDGLARAHLLDLAKANHLVSAGRADEADRLFRRALEANPRLVGAWHDLGNLYYHGYDTGKAWTCWDAARKIAPGHPMLRSVAELEERLERDFPDSF